MHLLVRITAVAAALVVALPGAASAAGDPCGGTGGIGTVIHAGGDTFSIRRHADGATQLVRAAHAPPLRAGDRVTLVGDPNADGSFTAATVVVCEPRPHAGHATGAPRPADAEQADRWDTRIDRAALLLVALTWIGVLAVLRVRQRRGLAYLLAFTVFFVYVVAVLDRTLFQFQSLIVLKHFAPHLMLNGQGDGDTMNLVPLVRLTPDDVETSLLNILLTVPLGFGLPCITRLRFAGTMLAGALFSVGIELLQLVTGLIGGITFRIADVNDVLFNTTGVVLGYGLSQLTRFSLRGCTRVRRRPSVGDAVGS